MSRKAIISDLYNGGLLTEAQASAAASDEAVTLAAFETGAAVADVSGTAGGTYTATEQGVINDTVTALNALLAELRTAGIITT